MEGGVQGAIQPGPGGVRVDMLTTEEIGIAHHAALGMNAIRHAPVLVRLKHGGMKADIQEIADLMHPHLWLRHQVLETHEKAAIFGNVGQKIVDVAVRMQPDEFGPLAAGKRRIGEVDGIQSAVQIGKHGRVRISDQVDITGVAEGDFDALQSLATEGIGSGFIHQRAARKPVLQTAIESMHRPVRGFIAGENSAGSFEIALE